MSDQPDYVVIRDSEGRMVPVAVDELEDLGGGRWRCPAESRLSGMTVIELPGGGYTLVSENDLTNNTRGIG